MKQKIDKFFEIVAEVMGGAVVIFLGVLSCSVLTQIVARVVFSKATPWAEEISCYSMIWACFLGSVRVLINKDHMVVDFFSARYQGNVRKITSLLIYLVEAVFFFFLLYYGIQLCRQPVVVNSRTSALHISRLYVYAVMPLSMALNFIYSVYGLMLNIKVLIKPSEHDDKVLCFAPSAFTNEEGKQ